MRFTSERVRTHGMSYSPEYRVWIGMLARCNNKNNASFEYYGGRGIRVCERWEKFVLFYEDMGPRPSPKHTLDRQDGDKNYEPSNCRWATPVEQSNNRDHLQTFLYKGEMMSLAQAIRAAGSVVEDSCARVRIKHGASIEYAVEAPPTSRDKRRANTILKRARGWDAP